MVFVAMRGPSLNGSLLRPLLLELRLRARLADGSLRSSEVASGVSVLTLFELPRLDDSRTG